MARHATNRNVNFGPMMLLTGAATDILGVCFYETNSVVRINGQSSSPLNQAAMCAANGKFYIPIDNNDWTIFSFDPKTGVVTEEICISSSAMTEINGIVVDSSGVIYAGDFGSGATTDNILKITAAGAIEWGPHSLNISSQTGEYPLVFELYSDRLFVAGMGASTNPFMFEVNVSDSTNNANGSRLCIEVDETLTMQYWGGMAIDPVNEKILMAAANTTSDYINYTIADLNQTDTASLTQYKVDLSSGLIDNTWSQGNWVFFDQTNEYWIFIFEASGTPNIVQVDAAGTTLVLDKSCSTLGKIRDACVNVAGDIFILTEDNEIVMLDDTLSVQWQCDIATSTATIYTGKLSFDETNQRLGILIHLDTTYDSVIFIAAPVGNVPTGEFAFTDPNTSVTITLSDMTADTWSAATHTVTAEAQNESQPTTMACNDDSEGSTATNDVSTEIDIG